MKTIYVRSTFQRFYFVIKSWSKYAIYLLKLLKVIYYENFETIISNLGFNEINSYVSSPMNTLRNITSL